MGVEATAVPLKMIFFPCRCYGWHAGGVGGFATRRGPEAPTVPLVGVRWWICAHIHGTRRPATPLLMIPPTVPFVHIPALSTDFIRRSPQDPTAPLLSLRCQLLPRFQHRLQILELRVIPRILHSVRPYTLALFENELSSVLAEGSPFQHQFACAQGLKEGAGGVCGEGFLHIIRMVFAQRQGNNHVEVGVETFWFVGVDGERARGLLAIEGDEGWVAATDDGYGCG